MFALIQLCDARQPNSLLHDLSGDVWKVTLQVGSKTYPQLMIIYVTSRANSEHAPHRSSRRIKGGVMKVKDERGLDLEFVVVLF